VYVTSIINYVQKDNFHHYSKIYSKVCSPTRGGHLASVRRFQSRTLPFSTVSPTLTDISMTEPGMGAPTLPFTPASAFGRNVKSLGGLQVEADGQVIAICCVFSYSLFLLGFIVIWLTLAVLWAAVLLPVKWSGRPPTA
jgi:hypothetical protein